MSNRKIRPIPAPTPNIIRLASVLLNLASEQFGRHGCNDFKIIDVPGFESKAARVELDRMYHEWNGDPQEHDPAYVGEYQADFALMSFCAAILANASGAAIEPDPADVRAAAIEHAERAVKEREEQIANCDAQAENIKREKRDSAKKLLAAQTALAKLKAS